MSESACELCLSPGGTIVWTDARCRVVLVDGEEGLAWPGFCRVIWHAHVAEMSDLAQTDREHLNNIVTAVEIALRQLQKPDKINLASLGNVVSHLHWHIIPRWRDDRCFPRPVWAEPLRGDTVCKPPTVSSLHQAIVASFLSESMRHDSKCDGSPY